MILVAGGTGTLGTRVVRALSESGTSVRVLTRHAERAQDLASDTVEIAVGDVQDLQSVTAAMRDVQTVVSAVQGFAGVEPAGPAAVDLDGNANLVRAAKAAGGKRFVLVSAAGAAPDSPLLLRRMKFAAEQTVTDSGLEWCVLRPTVYLETWLGLLGDMATTKGSVTLFGRGNNPINFVSADDVAALTIRAVRCADLTGTLLEIGGPQDLTLNALARHVLAAHGRDPKIHHVPLPILRTLSAMLRPVKPNVAMLAKFGVVMDTTDMTLHHDSARAAIPDLPSTSLETIEARG